MKQLLDRLPSDSFDSDLLKEKAIRDCEKEDGGESSLTSDSGSTLSMSLSACVCKQQF